jgi:MerR family transcriptional regulator, light-induced transcriptional regulator
VEASGVLRIGELSRRSGVSPELLRAWERRYGLLEPTRSSGGLRLYSDADLERVRRMQQHLAAGVAAAEAAALAQETPSATLGARYEPDAARRDLSGALEAFDEPVANALLDRLLSTTTLDSLLSEVVIPYLHELGDRWESGEVSVAQEHFASNVLRGRLLGLARDWGRGLGPKALLACAPGERHDLGLIAFGLALRARGWRIGYLGADNPFESIDSAARAFEPDLVVISAVASERFDGLAGDLRSLARAHRVCLAGAGANGIDGSEFAVEILSGDPVTEAERLSQPTSRAERPATSSSASSGTSART